MTDEVKPTPSICDNCKYGYFYEKPQKPEPDNPIIGKRTGLTKFIFEKIFTN